jgi:hypothetical protein
MEKLYWFFLLFSVVFSACTFDSQGLNAQTDDCAGMNCGHGICVKLPGASAECQCESNWQGVACDQCIVGYAGADCADCAEGYELNDVELCVPVVVSPCEPNPCLHGTCVDLGEQSIRCECETGYVGLLCGDCAEGYEVSGDECVPIPDPCESLDCGAHGSCVVDGQGQTASCNCEAGYLGDRCQNCDTVNGYVIDGGACRLNPCFERDCGTGSCVIDTLNWTASCACPATAFGENCEYLIANSLIYQESSNRVFIQVKDARWMASTNTLRMSRSGSVTLPSNILYDQSMVLYGGWFPYRPCLAVDEEVTFVLYEQKTGGDLRLKIEYLPPINSADPHGFVLDTSADLNQDVFRAECYDCANGGCKVRPAGGATP